MGLLDDAIREHLDLKRRRGADPHEIAREETEALGPVRREAPAGESEAAAEPAPAVEPELDFELEREPEPRSYADDHDHDHDRPTPAEPPTTHDAPYAEREDESATPPHGDPYQPTREFSSAELDEALSDPAPPAAPAPPADVVPADDAGDDDGEDPLEETPDFLQETPEHDRLWFEQKPPKDFDF